MLVPGMHVYTATCGEYLPLQWRHNELDGVSDHQSHDCLLDRLFRRRPKKISKLRVTGLCVGNSPLTGEFPAQRASNTEHVSIWWHHHVQFWTCTNGLDYGTILAEEYFLSIGTVISFKYLVYDRRCGIILIALLSPMVLKSKWKTP